MELYNPCFSGEDNVTDRENFAARLHIGNYLNFNKPVHVQLGDLVTGPDGNRVVQVSSYGIHLIETDPNTIVCPVPLTEEWIKALGFIKIPRTPGDYCRGFSDHLHSALILRPETGFSWSVLYMHGTSFSNLPTLMFVHDLQNLYSRFSPANRLILKK